MYDGTTIGVASGGGWNDDETVGAFVVLTLTGSFEFKVGDGLGTAIVPISLEVDVDNIMMLFFNEFI